MRDGGSSRRVVERVTASEREIGKMLAEAFDALPDAKKERLLGYAEGVADMREAMSRAQAERESA